MTAGVSGFPVTPASFLFGGDLSFYDVMLTLFFLLVIAVPASLSSLCEPRRSSSAALLRPRPPGAPSQRPPRRGRAQVLLPVEETFATLPGGFLA